MATKCFLLLHLSSNNSFSCSFVNRSFPFHPHLHLTFSSNSYAHLIKPVTLPAKQWTIMINIFQEWKTRRTEHKFILAFLFNQTSFSSYFHHLPFSLHLLLIFHLHLFSPFYCILLGFSSWYHIHFMKTHPFSIIYPFSTLPSH